MRLGVRNKSGELLSSLLTTSESLSNVGRFRFDVTDRKQASRIVLYQIATAEKMYQRALNSLLFPIFKSLVAFIVFHFCIYFSEVLSAVSVNYLHLHRLTYLGATM